MFYDSVLETVGSISGAFNEATMDPELAAAMNLESANDIIGDPLEYAIESAYEFRMNNMAIDMQGIMEEYSFLRANGREMETVQEAVGETIKAWFSKAKEAIIAFGKKVAEFFKKVLHNINVRLKGEVEFVKKYEKLGLGTVKLDKGIEIFDAKKAGQMGTPEKLYDILTAFNGKTGKTVEVATKTGGTTTDENGNTTELPGGTKIQNNTADKINGAFKAMLAEYVAAFGGTGSYDSADKVKTKVREIIKNARTVAGSVNVKTALDYLGGVMAERKKVEKLFNNAKKSIDIALKEAKLLEAQCAKNKGLFGAARAAITNLQKSLILCSFTNQITVQMVEVTRRQNKALVKAAVAADKKANPEYADDAYASLTEGAAFFGTAY